MSKKSDIKFKTSDKGFTLVELLVVLVILAIMAAIAVPAMLGFTDSAKEKEYTAQAGSALKATQSVLSDLYNPLEQVSILQPIPQEPEARQLTPPG